ncbi:DHS-like NAD/FAD-binding domain-containing protein [Lipomyces japonicus]|uniref:DHS-like NAD/FAD-binding domain-containing protein n=1 Tax=Lipomyces japonicus TaxID=56871 RepID=UPI0034D01304
MQKIYNRTELIPRIGVHICWLKTSLKFHKSRSDLQLDVYFKFYIMTASPASGKKPRMAKPKWPYNHDSPFVYKLNSVKIENEEFAATLHKLLTKSKKLVIVLGAGISVGAGIPDFRSSTGLFKTMKTDYKLKGSGQSMFDASVYGSGKTTTMFHAMMNNLHSLSSGARITNMHQLISKLSTENKLLRVYTQNIDGLEESLEGLSTVVPLPSKPPWPRTIQLHGGLKTMNCSKCGFLAPFNPQVFAGQDIPECNECKEFEMVRAVVGKRTQGIGKMRPRIVLYNEFNPDGEAIGNVTAADLKSRPDGLLVIGTSLKVPGVRRIVKEMAQSVHAAKGLTVWINHEDPPGGKIFENVFDVIIKGDCQLVPGLIRTWDEFASRPKPVKKAAKRKAVVKDEQKLDVIMPVIDNGSDGEKAFEIVIRAEQSKTRQANKITDTFKAVKTVTLASSKRLKVENDSIT